eukprot:124927-Pleurochrysis_carterae.AAC.3
MDQALRCNPFWIAIITSSSSFRSLTVVPPLGPSELAVRQMCSSFRKWAAFFCLSIKSSCRLPRFAGAEAAAEGGRAFVVE